MNTPLLFSVLGERLAIATYDTDYVLVREAQLEQAVAALERHGHRKV